MHRLDDLIGPALGHVAAIAGAGRPLALGAAVSARPGITAHQRNRHRLCGTRGQGCRQKQRNKPCRLHCPDSTTTNQETMAASLGARQRATGGQYP
mmetsp:Transcript_16463/g.41442  ORF Transcript_16463/g.41442 Transcript_16463/m.41442 type:complete len:96 (+) Transcript_16463:1245-1532(+)